MVISELTNSISILRSEMAHAGIDIDDSARRRSDYSFDASNYRVKPMAVAFPRNAEEVGLIVRACAKLGVALTTRGGGTSMAGNAVGSGLILDLSRWMRDIGEIDEEAQSVWVDAGVVLGELRTHIHRQTGGRLTFAPDPSSLTRATVGGSIGNDACGNHSVAYGRMTHHVTDLEVVTSDGVHLHASRGGVRAVDSNDPTAVQRASDLNLELTDLIQANLAAVRLELETIPRQVSGYHLGQLLPEHGFDIARALAGSEGSCAVITRARVNLVANPPATALLCLGYADTVDSARDIVPILASNPSAIEGLDALIVDIMRHRRGQESVNSLPNGNAFLMVEFSADSLDQAEARCRELLETVHELGRALDHAIVIDPLERAKLWRVREDGAGLSSRRIDGRQTWPGWEDSAVAPENLADYLRELLSLVDEFGYTAYTYGHFGAGCVHMRLDYDLRSETGRTDFEAFTRRAARLVVQHGGSLSGEHGDGRARSELLEVMYSPEIIDLFRSFKRAWDPEGRLNPGIIVDPFPFTNELALENMPAPLPVTVRREEMVGSTRLGSIIRTRAQVELESPFVGNAHACIGVGRCRSTSGGFMCPSYRATKDEKDSTRGRARVLQELVRNNGNSLQGWNSPEVREALDLCLSCKACSSDCPTGVDIAEAKSQLIDDHYRRRLRPFTHYSIGWLPRWLPMLTRMSAIANMMSSLKPLRVIGEWLGVSARRKLPAFGSSTALRASVREAEFAEAADVLIFADSFTKAFRPEVIPAAARVLRSTGQSVGCTPEACCGLTWISTGQREGARRRLSKLVEKFDDGSARDIVVLEPSCAAAIRDEAPKLVGGAAAARVAKRVKSFAVAVDQAVAGGWTPTAPAPQAAVLQAHCHEHAVFGSGAQKRILEAWGTPNISVSSSCCGVAGNFGFEAEHFDVSMKVAEHSIIPALEAGGPEALVLTDGFSCAMQVGQIDPALKSRHLALALDPSSGLGGVSSWPGR